MPQSFATQLRILSAVGRRARLRKGNKGNNNHCPHFTGSLQRINDLASESLRALHSCPFNKELLFCLKNKKKKKDRKRKKEGRKKKASPSLWSPGTSALAQLRFHSGCVSLRRFLNLSEPLSPPVK